MFDKPTGGAITGTFPVSAEGNASSFECIGFFSNRTRRDVRRGFKRIGGLSAGSLLNNGVIDSSLQVVADAVDVALGAQLSSTIGATSFTFDPIVEHLQAYTTGSGRTAYRAWQDEDGNLDEATALLNTMVVNDWSHGDYVTTQNSRKRGRGI